MGRARHAVTMVQGVGAKESEHRDAVTETPQGGQGQAGLHADPGIAERRGGISTASDLLGVTNSTRRYAGCIDEMANNTSPHNK